jgi:hypothetical protein
VFHRRCFLVGYLYSCCSVLSNLLRRVWFFKKKYVILTRAFLYVFGATPIWVYKIPTAVYIFLRKLGLFGPWCDQFYLNSLEQFFEWNPVTVWGT